MLADTGLSERRHRKRPRPHSPSSAQLIEELGGEYRKVTSNDVAAALVDVARAENATQIVLGASARSRLARADQRLGDQPGRAAIRPIDVHVISRSRRRRDRRGDDSTATAPGRQAGARAAVTTAPALAAGSSRSSACRS